MSRRALFLLLVVVSCVVLAPAPALAGPGGTIASAVFKTFWGRVLLSILTLLLLPFILYLVLRERRAERRTLSDLRNLASVDPRFDWLTLRERVIECFHQVHGAWRKEEMARAADWMTDWYWRNQQMAHLDRWAEEGLFNHCTVKSLSRLRPLHLAVRGDRSGFDGTRLAVAIKASMEDFLAERESGKVVEGARGFDEHETVWTFALEGGAWRVALIEPDAMTLTYARMANELPETLRATPPLARRELS